MKFYKNKFNATKVTYRGTTYHSRKEAEYAMWLDQEKKKGNILNWEGQVKIPLKVNNKLVCNYICDFQVTNKDKEIELVEVKGMRTATFNLKLKLFKALYPELKYTIV